MGNLVTDYKTRIEHVQTSISNSKHVDMADAPSSFGHHFLTVHKVYWRPLDGIPESTKRAARYPFLDIK